MCHTSTSAKCGGGEAPKLVRWVFQCACRRLQRPSIQNALFSATADTHASLRAHLP